MKRIMLGGVTVLLAVLGVAFVVCAALMAGCAPTATVDDASPRCASARVAAGSDMTETSQYVEARFTFDQPLEATGDAAAVASDFAVTLNGAAPDERTIAVEATVEGPDVVVRLVPASGADGSDASVYFAVYDGLVRVAASAENGGLAHVKAQGGSSSAVMDAPLEFTVPSGVEVAQVDAGAADADAGTGAWVTFDFTQFAQLRSCTWFWFADGLPLVMIHNHEYARDLPETVAARFADTVNTNYGDDLEAEADGARVTVRALQAVDGQELTVRLSEGIGANPGAGVCGTDALSATYRDGSWAALAEGDAGAGADADAASDAGAGAAAGGEAV